MYHRFGITFSNLTRQSGRQQSNAYFLDNVVFIYVVVFLMAH
jgi:hypothetical protein